MYVKPNLEVKNLKQELKTTKAVLELKEADLVRMAEDLADIKAQRDFISKKNHELLNKNAELYWQAQKDQELREKNAVQADRIKELENLTTLREGIKELEISFVPLFNEKVDKRVVELAAQLSESEDNLACANEDLATVRKRLEFVEQREQEANVAYVDRVEELKKSLKDAGEKIAIIRKQLDETREAYAAKVDESAVLLVRHAEKIDEVKGLQAQRDLITKQNLELRKKLAGRCDCSTLKKQVEDLTRMKDDLSARNRDYVNRNVELSRRCDELKKEHECQLTNVKWVNGQLEERLEYRLGCIEELQYQLANVKSQLQSQLQDHQEENTRLKKNIEVLLKQKSELQASNRAFVSGNKALRKRVVELATELSELEITCGSRLQQIEELRAQLDNVMWANEKLRTELDRWEKLADTMAEGLKNA